MIGLILKTVYWTMFSWIAIGLEKQFFNLTVDQLQSQLDSMTDDMESDESNLRTLLPNDSMKVQLNVDGTWTLISQVTEESAGIVITSEKK